MPKICSGIRSIWKTATRVVCIFNAQPLLLHDTGANFCETGAEEHVPNIFVEGASLMRDPVMSGKIF